MKLLVLATFSRKSVNYASVLLVAENLLIGSSPDILKIGDFGLAAELESGMVQSGIHGYLAGTFLYMAPEVSTL